MAGSQRKVWWVCPEGHEYLQPILKRTTRGHACPYCSGHKVLKGFNDFETKYPEIAKEWHPTKNGNLTPSDVTYGSGKKVWWKCPIGHEYQANVHDRGSGQTNCPICSLRKSTSFPEQAVLYYMKKLWPNSLSKYKNCFKNSMEFDVYIPELKVAIEYDGAQWHKTEPEHKREIKKYEFCKQQKVYLIRIKEQTEDSWNDTADKIYYIPPIKKNYHDLERVILHILASISGIKSSFLEINIERDKNEILSYLSSIPNSLSEIRPDIAAKWNYEKNGNLTPDMFSVGSNEVVWWKCQDCGKEWKTSIINMTGSRYGCPSCSLKNRGSEFTKLRVKERGSLADKMPELINEWHPTKNGNLTPYDITVGRFKPVWWKCHKCGYEWQASPNHRKRGIGCPCCAGRVPQKGINDLKTKYPDIAREWDYEKNYPALPEDFLPGSGKKVWWKCSVCGKSWQAIIVNRVKKSKQQGCRSCKAKIRGAKKKYKNQLDFNF